MLEIHGDLGYACLLFRMRGARPMESLVPRVMPRFARWIGRLFDYSWLHFCGFLNILSVFIAGLFFAWQWLPIALLLMFVIGWLQWHDLVSRLPTAAQTSPKPEDHVAAGSLPTLYAKIRHVTKILAYNIQRDTLIMAVVFAIGSLIRWMATFE